MKKAFELALKACELLHPDACTNVARMYEIGNGVDKNEEMAKKYRNIANEIKEDKTKKAYHLQFGTGKA